MSEPRWDTFAAELDGSLCRPGDAEFERLRVPAIRRYARVRPRAIAACRSAHDVGEAVRFARAHRLPSAVRSGGHDFAGRSSTDGLLIDLSGMASVALRDGLVHVGAGVRLGALYRRLAATGLTLPAGCGATVGIGGHTLSGGLGLLGRRFGLTCDRLRAAEVVLPDGRVVTCDEQHHADVFWALRGSGDGGGTVATSFSFAPVQDVALIRFELRWRAADAATVMAAWQAWAPGAPHAVTSAMTITATAGLPLDVRVTGAVIAAEADWEGEVEAFAARVGHAPQRVVTRHGTHGSLKREAPDEAHEETDAVSRSELFAGPLPGDTIAALVRHLRAPATGLERRLELLALGGSYRDVSGDATAFAHREQAFALKHTVVVPPPTGPAERAAAASWLHVSHALSARHGSGRVLPGFPDATLRRPARAYLAQHERKLTRIRRRMTEPA